MVAPARGGAAPRQPVVHPDPTTGATPAHVGGIEGDIAHAFGAAGDNQIVVAVADLQTGRDDRLQTRSASPVDLHTGNRPRQSGIQRHHTSDRRRLAAGIAVPEDDVLDCLRCYSGSVEQALEGTDSEIDGAQRLEHAPVAADRRPNRFADDRFAHTYSSDPGHMNRPPVTSMTVPVI